ncbi:PHOX1-like protein [Drosera capensis]
MGKPTGKKNKKAEGSSKQGAAQVKNRKGHDRTKPVDEDTAVFIAMSQELKEEGNRLFQSRNLEGAMLMYEKALKLLPKIHIDVAGLRTNMAACYMGMGIGEYPRAINECNLALEVAPRYSKALLKRAKCFEALNRCGLAWRDVRFVLSMEPNNLTGLEIEERLKKVMKEKGVVLDEKVVGVGSESTAPSNGVSKHGTTTKEKQNKKEKKKGVKVEETSQQSEEENVADKSKLWDQETKEKELNLKDKSVKTEDLEEKSNLEDKEVVQEQVQVKEEVTRMVKLVLRDNIRWAQLPTNFDLGLMRGIVRDKFPNLKGALIKYQDQEGDLITITTTDELRKAVGSSDSQGSTRLYIVEVDLDPEPDYVSDEKKVTGSHRHVDRSRGDDVVSIDNWIVQFAEMFKNHVGFGSDAYLNLHEIGMTLYSQAIEDTITSEEAQDLFDIASDKFQEMVALALFNWGNVHMSKARKRVIIKEEDVDESVNSKLKAAYEWAQKEYMRARMRYEEAMKIKPDFYEGLLALGRQHFEQAKLSWNYAIATKVDLEASASSEVLQLYNKAEDNMEAGMHLWEEMEERWQNGLSKEENLRSQLEKLGLDALINDVTEDEATEQAAGMRSQINILWGTMLYERSIVEFKLGLPTWEECLEVAVEKFELAGASNVDIGVMIKNHVSNQTGQEDFSFRIEEIVQAWHEMYDAKRWQIGTSSFRLEPLFRRRLPRLNSILEHI